MIPAAAVGAKAAARSLAAGAVLAACFAGGTMAGGLDEMTGCWISRAFDATSLLSDSSDAGSAELVHEKMLLRFDRIEGTEHLAFGRIFEWDEPKSYVLGPTYQNGAYNPAADFLTFGFPEGGLDHVTQPDADSLLYVHTKSSTKSAMSVRPLVRIGCEEADDIEADLLARQEALKTD
ncbi:hypothetical protein [Microbaculum marinum]|uniref:Uncharacterized protein n=1 Tax=Microbaculum marinum TaxID=1764581 RepID=A0AAW9RJS8_9HYPH